MAKTTKDNSALIAQAESAISIATELKTIIDEIVENGGECGDETLKKLQEWQGALEYKAENIGFAKLELEAAAAKYKAIEEIAKARRQARESAIERIKKYLVGCMKTADVKSIKKIDGLFSFSLVEGRIKTVIEDEQKLPYDYVDIVEVVKPKTDAIKSALEAGQEVSGAHLERGEDYVMIRGGKVNA
ncbi:MAG: siphovirus Gp157 family protein [Candidatus Riflebacteria bacterium]|nr:siphovirus Gp157 family protein [Candidatus Riflebacteria bacterium]